MSILVYSSSTREDAQHLVEAIQFSVTSPTIQFTDSLLELREMFKRHHSEFDVVVLIIEDHYSLECLLEMQSILKDFRTVLVLGDTNSDLVSKSRALYPRFVGYMSNDNSEVVAVLGKMIEKEIGHTSAF